jgi:glycosyltransferase involved in cell wall biosynthesis
MPTAPPFRLLVVASARPGAAGGALRILDRVCQGLAARGLPVEVLAGGGGAAHGAPDAETAVRQVRAAMSERQAALDARITAFAPTVIHCEFADDIGHAALAVARARRVPCTATFHRLESLSAGIAREGLLQAMLAFHRNAARTVAYSRPLAAWLGAQGVGNAVAIANGVDARRFDPALRDERARARWGAGAGEVVLLWVGRLLPQKNLALLASAFRAARAACPAVRGVIIGDGPARAALQEQLPWAAFPGIVEGPELRVAYASADLFVFPSRSSGIETWANVVGEAMAAALPVVAFALGAADAWIVDGHNGAVVPETADEQADAAAFTAAVVALAGDRQRRRAWGAAARTAVLDQGWDRTIDRYQDLFTSCTAGRP